MKKISIWARQHVFAAQLLIVILHIYLLLSALLISGWLADQHTNIVAQWFVIPIIIGIVLLVAFWVFNEKLLLNTTRFVVGKTKIAIMAVCSFIFVLGLMHTDAIKKAGLYSMVQGNFSESAIKSTRPQYGDYLDKNDFYKDLDAYYRTLSKKELKWELKKELKAARKESDVAKTLYILLILIGAFVALFGVAALSCGVACGGSGGLAVVLLLLGTVGVVFLTVYLIRMVLGKKKIKPTEEVNTN